MLNVVAVLGVTSVARHQVRKGVEWGSMLSCLTVTIIECNFMDAIAIDNNEIVPSSCCWIGALFANVVVQLNTKTHIFQCCMLEKIAVPALKMKSKVNNKATSNVETRIHVSQCGDTGCTHANQ